MLYYETRKKICENNKIARKSFIVAKKMFFLCHRYTQNDKEIQWSKSYETRKEAIVDMIEKHINERINDKLFYSDKFRCEKEIDELYYFLYDEYCKLRNGAALPNIVYTNKQSLLEQIQSATTFDQLCVCEIFTNQNSNNCHK
jgi:hypothetical protein